jgi:hypothetical protein
VKDEPFQLVRKVFGDGRLVVAPAHLVEPLSLPARSKLYLTTVGFPRKEEAFGLEFNLLDRLPTLRQLLPESADRIDPAWDACPFLSLQYDAGFYVSQIDGGEVWQASLDERESLYVNSAVEFLGACLAVCNEPTTRPLENDRDRLASIEQLEERMRRLDPPAMEDVANFWPTLLHHHKTLLNA